VIAWSRSLRWRLAAAIALIAAALCASIGLSVYYLTANDRLARARDAQAERAVLAAGLVRSTGQTLVGAEIDSPRAPAALRRAVAAGGIATYRVADPRPTIWAGAPLARGVGGRGVYVRGSFAPDDRALAQLRDTLLLAGVVGTVLAALLGALLASGLSRRLRRAAAVADRVAAGDDAARIRATGHDEVARLSRAVDAMSDALAARLAREQRFAADAAHELRTPLTALTSAAELLDDSRPAQIVRERVSALRALVAELLELAQLDAGRGEPAASEEVPLGEWAGAFVARHAPDARLELDDPATVRTDRRRLERIVGNLLDNAERHGEPPVVVRIAGTAIEVRDHGPGFPHELLREGPRRFWTGDDRRGGSGLGLTIAAGHADAIGAALTFSNRPDGGGTARLSGLGGRP
jgi:signal transduction histidine kinase